MVIYKMIKDLQHKGIHNESVLKTAPEQMMTYIHSSVQFAQSPQN